MLAAEERSRRCRQPRSSAWARMRGSGDFATTARLTRWVRCGAPRRTCLLHLRAVHEAVDDQRVRARCEELGEPHLLRAAISASLFEHIVLGHHAAWRKLAPDGGRPLRGATCLDLRLEQAVARLVGTLATRQGNGRLISSSLPGPLLARPWPSLGAADGPSDERGGYAPQVGCQVRWTGGRCRHADAD